MQHRAHRIARQHLKHVLRRLQPENAHHRHGVFTQHDEGGRIHHAKVALGGLRIGDFFNQRGGSVLMGVGGVHAVDVLCHEDSVALQLDCAQHHRAVCGEAGIAQPTGQKEDVPAVKPLDRLDGIIALGKAWNIHAAHHRGLRAHVRERIAHIQAVLQGAQHSHLVGGDCAHAHSCPAAAAPHVAPADHHGELYARSADLHQHSRGLLKFLVAKQLSIHAQRLAAEL